MSKGPRRENGADRDRRDVRAIVLAVILGLIGSGALVWQGTSAVFTATTANAANSWTLGTVTLADDDSAAALFSASGLLPASTGSNCITVTYSGNVATTVRLYASASADAGSVAQYIDVTVQQGTGGGFGSCGAFVPSSTVYTGTLDNFTATSTAYGNGVGTWAPSSPSSTVYKISYTLNAATPGNKQGAATTATFQWEAQA